MSDKRKFSAISMGILEFLATQSAPASASEIAKALKPEYREKSKYLFSSLVRIEAIVSKINAEGRQGFLISKKGRQIIDKKNTFILVDVIKEAESNLKHPDTGEPISAYRLRKLQEERGEYKPKRQNKKPEPETGGALPNVSSNANNLMDHISTVIHENAAYREALARIGNEIAALLDMRMVPRNPQ